jgi:hypothetical protein
MIRAGVRLHDDTNIIELNTLEDGSLLPGQ